MDNNNIKMKPFLEGIINLEIQKAVTDNSMKELNVLIEEAEANKNEEIKSLRIKLGQATDYRCSKKCDEIEHTKKIVRRILIIISLFFMIKLGFLFFLALIIIGSFAIKIITSSIEKKAVENIIKNTTEESNNEISTIVSKYSYKGRYVNELNAFNNDLESINCTLTNLYNEFKTQFPKFQTFTSLECISHLYNFFEDEGYDADTKMCIEELGQIETLNLFNKEINKREGQINNIASDMFADLEDVQEEIKSKSQSIYKDFDNMSAKLDQKTNTAISMHHLQVIELCDLINNKQRLTYNGQ